MLGVGSRHRYWMLILSVHPKSTWRLLDKGVVGMLLDARSGGIVLDVKPGTVKRSELMDFF